MDKGYKEEVWEELGKSEYDQNTCIKYSKKYQISLKTHQTESERHTENIFNIFSMCKQINKQYEKKMLIKTQLIIWRVSF